MFKVALIGCGNLGSRHLQALKLTNKELDITVCEPDEQAIKIAQERYNQVEGSSFRKTIRFISDYRELSEDIDLVIVATTSASRFSIAEWVLLHVNIKYILLEKVVFQSLDELDQFSDLLRNRAVKVWVNCPRRMFEFYKKLKGQIYGKSDINMTIQGVEWGMACNAIHILDLYRFLTGFTVCEYNNEKMFQGYYDSKREGYLEFYGKIELTTDKGKLILDCDKGDVATDRIIIQMPEEWIEIDESTREATIHSYEKEEVTERLSVDIKYQSFLTNIVVEQIINNGECELSIYEDSALLHKILLSCFLNHINKYTNVEVKKCPIT